MEKVTQVTSLEELKKIANGEIVQLPPFVGDEPFYARLRRPSMLVLAKSGKIPNALLSSASELFQSGADSLVANEQMLTDMYDICLILADACLVEPSLSQIEEVGLNLTDEQLLAIFNYSQGGVKALKPFLGE